MEKKDVSFLIKALDDTKDKILDCERHIWNNPEPGYREWKTHEYLKGLYEELGYELHEFDNIPGFYIDVETGKEGPTLAVFGEMDSLVIPTHPEADPETGAVHACGHNCQCAELYGLAIALKQPGALDGLCGRIRLIAVPAEELIEINFREELMAKGIIKFFGGKQELIYRGVLDDVDLAMMIHTKSSPGLGCGPGSNGCIAKVATFKGKAAHAGGAPQNGINALYAAQSALAAANALRETFMEKDYVRFHPIITEGGTSVNTIPDKVVVESYVRAATMEAIETNNEKINRAFASCAAAMGCEFEIKDMIGYAPRKNDDTMREVMMEAGRYVFDESLLNNNVAFGKGCSDMGDVSTIMPCVHPHIGGATGAGHGVDYIITDPYSATVKGAQILAIAATRFLENDAAIAKKVVAEYEPVYKNSKEYLEAMGKINFKKDAVVYNEDGSISISYKK